MPAIQQVEVQKFGVGRIYLTPSGGGSRLVVADCNDMALDLKTEQKEIWSEGGWPIAVADGHRSCDITGKHWTLGLDVVANDFNGSTPTTTTALTAVDEAGTIASVGHTYTLAHSTAVDKSFTVVEFIPVSGGVPYPVYLQEVTAGSEVAGVSYSYAAGVLTFASGDAGNAILVTYDYTAGTATGVFTLLTNTYQNSSPSYTMKLLKRDRSPIDNSTGILRVDLYAVRPGGIKVPFKEDDWSAYDRTWKAFANPIGNVMAFTFFNV